MNKIIKYTAAALAAITAIFIIYTQKSSDNALISNFDVLETDYDNIANAVRSFYNNNINAVSDGGKYNIDTITLEINGESLELPRDDFMLPDQRSERSIALTEEQKISLNKIQSMSYTSYDIITVSQQYITFANRDKHYRLLYKYRPDEFLEEMKKQGYVCHKLNDYYCELYIETENGEIK